MKRQALQHTYGQDEDVDEEEAVDPAVIEGAREAMRGTQEVNGDVVHISGRSCRCGSGQHKRTLHSLCPLNPRNNGN